MGEQAGYGQFCPVAMAAEVLGGRWTLLVVRELLCGTTRFNDLRRGVPRMSPTLLSKRLKELEAAGVVAAHPTAHAGVVDYRLTQAGEDLRPVVMGVGAWGHRWVESSLSLRNLDPSLLMWDMRRHLDPTPMPPGRRTIRFDYPDVAEPRRTFWLVVDGGVVDLCSVDPGFDVDLHVRCPLRTMTAIWMGLASVRAERAEGRLELDGNGAMITAMQGWLGLSPFAKAPRAVA